MTQGYREKREAQPRGGEVGLKLMLIILEWFRKGNTIEYLEEPFS